VRTVQRTKAGKNFRTRDQENFGSTPKYCPKLRDLKEHPRDPPAATEKTGQARRL
jgi:hypothetical protein